MIYLDGNSLGPLQTHVAEKLSNTVAKEWGDGLTSSWNDAGWIDLPAKLGDRIARLIGAGAGEVVIGDSTSVNIFKLACALLAKDTKQRKIVTERDNFPTDIYVLQGLVALFGNRHELILAAQDEIQDLIDDDTALVLLTHVNYRTGQIFDMAALTERAHATGTPIIWDLCHTVGALPVDLRGCSVEYAVGCTYKYLNGGPGAPAFTYISANLIDEFQPIVTGWFSHARQFEFEANYESDDSIKKATVGTPGILGLAALDAALDIWDEVSLDAIRDKSVSLCEEFISLVETAYSSHDLKLVSPRDSAERGSQVSLSHPDGYAVMQALIARGVIGDFRAPDIMRFGFAPLYTRYVDVFDAVEHVRDVLETGEWKKPEFAVRQAVT